MNKTIIGIALTAILAFSILFAFFFVQGFFSTSPNITAVSSPVANGLQLFMALDANKTSFVQGENISITLALINTSNQTKSVTDVNAESIFNFEVYDHGNNWVYMYEVGAYPIINKTITISPKGNYNETFTWEQGGTFGYPSQEPVGTYYIEGNINDNGSIPFLQTPRLAIVIKYPLIYATVFLVPFVACICMILFLYLWHRKTAMKKKF